MAFGPLLSDPYRSLPSDMKIEEDYSPCRLCVPSSPPRPRFTKVVWSMTEPFPSRSCAIWPFWRSTAFAHRKDGREDRRPHFRGLPHRLAAGQLQNCPHLHQVRGHSFFYLDSCLTPHRSFLSSTFTDMLMERNTLMEYVYPKMKEYCREKHGLEFQVCS